MSRVPERAARRGRERSDLVWTAGDREDVQVETIATTPDAEELETVVLCFRDIAERKERQRDLDATRRPSSVGVTPSTG
ncbi:MAG: hypothetical protein V5A43_00350 [Haloarculaceae archaeon]